MPAGSDYAVFWGDMGEQQMKIYGQDGLGVRSGDVVLDCGANVGVYIRVPHSGRGPPGGGYRAGAGEPRVPAAEPSPTRFARGGSSSTHKGVWD